MNRISVGANEAAASCRDGHLTESRKAAKLLSGGTTALRPSNCDDSLGYRCVGASLGNSLTQKWRGLDMRCKEHLIYGRDGEARERARRRQAANLVERLS